jgi:hypothetical protein
VLAPGSRLRADLALEGELQSLLATPESHSSRASLGLVLLDLRPSPVRVLLQGEAAGTAPIEAAGPPGIARAGQTAVARLMTQVESRIAGALNS